MAVTSEEESGQRSSQRMQLPPAFVSMATQNTNPFEASTALQLPDATHTGTLSRRSTPMRDSANHGTPNESLLLEVARKEQQLQTLLTETHKVLGANNSLPSSNTPCLPLTEGDTADLLGLDSPQHSLALVKPGNHNLPMHQQHNSRSVQTGPRAAHQLQEDGFPPDGPTPTRLFPGGTYPSPANKHPADGSSSEWIVHKQPSFSQPTMASQVALPDPPVRALNSDPPQVHAVDSGGSSVGLSDALGSSAIASNPFEESHQATLKEQASSHVRTPTMPSTSQTKGARQFPTRRPAPDSSTSTNDATVSVPSLTAPDDQEMTFSQAADALTLHSPVSSARPSTKTPSDFSQVASPIQGTKILRSPLGPQDRTRCGAPNSRLPIEMRCANRHHVGRRGLPTPSCIWTLDVVETCPGAFQAWTIPMAPGRYQFEDHGNPLCVVASHDNVPCFLAFPVLHSRAWAFQGLSRPPGLNSELNPCVLPLVPSRAPRVGGFLHPHCYGVPGIHDTLKRSLKPFCTPTAVFEDDGVIITQSWAAACYRGTTASYFGVRGGSVNMRSFHTEAELPRCCRSSAPSAVSRPSLVPCVRVQLESLGLMEDEDCDGVFKNSTLLFGREIGKLTPILCSLDQRSQKHVPWDLHHSLPADPVPDTRRNASNSSEDNNSHPLSAITCLPATDASMSGPTSISSHASSRTCTDEEEREWSKDRFRNLKMPPMPLAGPALKNWIDSLSWTLSGHQWNHNGEHVCDITTTASDNKVLSQDFLTAMKQACMAHKSQDSQRAAMSLLREEIRGADGNKLIQAGKGFELCQTRIKTGFNRGLGSETVTNLLSHIHAVQKSQETVGAFFIRLGQLHDQVQVMEGCAIGDIARKAFALEGLRNGAYHEVLEPFVKRVQLGQSKIKFLTSAMAEIQNAATDVLISSRFCKDHAIQSSSLPGGRARAAHADNPSDDPMIEDIVDRIRRRQHLSKEMALWQQKNFKCVQCWSNDHDMTQCYRLKGKFTITRKEPPTSTPGGVLPSNKGRKAVAGSEKTPQNAEAGESSNDPPSTSKKANKVTDVPQGETEADEFDIPNASVDDESEADESDDTFALLHPLDSPDDELLKALQAQAARKAQENESLFPSQASENRVPKTVARLAKSDLKWIQPKPTTALCEDNNAWTTKMCDAKGSKIVESVGSYLDSRALCPDSGATNTMCPNADMFLEHTSIAHEHKHVRLGDENQRVLIHGIGTMGLQIGDKATVHGKVSHVPELSSVLLSSRVHRRITGGCSFVADHSGCFLTHPEFAFEVDDEGDCTIECTPISSDVTEHDFDSRLHVNQHSSKQQQTRKMKLAFDMMHRARKSQLSSSRQPIKSRDLAVEFNPDSPMCSIPESGIQSAERIHTLDLQKMFGCRKLKNWKCLEHTGTGVSVVNDLEPPAPLGEMATIKRNPKGKLLDRPANRLHAVGMDIGCGNGDSPGGYRHALTLVDHCTRCTWTYGLKSKSAESIIQALWSFFLDAGGCPTRIRCDFDPSFVKGKVAEFLKVHQIKISSSPPGRQSQNGLVERQWQTATAMARALLIEAQLPRRFWFWALREAVIRMNMLPCRPQPQDASVAIDVNELTTPHELCYLDKPDYRTLFSWGSIGFYRKLNN